MPELIKDGEDAGNKKLGPKKGFEKYKWWLIGGLAVIAILVFYFVRKNQQGSSSQQAQPGIDPNTGLPYASEYGYGGAYGGSSGIAGPAGPAGPTGPRGPAGPSGGGGSGSVTVPSVIGMNRAESRAALAAVGLVYKQANVVHGTAKAVSESPSAGSKVKLGSTVTVTMQEVGGKSGGGGGGGDGTRIAGQAAKPLVLKPTPRITGVATLVSTAGHTSSSAKPGVGGILPKVNQAA